MNVDSTFDCVTFYNLFHFSCNFNFIYILRGDIDTCGCVVRCYVVRRRDRWGEGTLSDVGALSGATLLDVGIAGARGRCQTWVRCQALRC